MGAGAKVWRGSFIHSMLKSFPCPGAHIILTEKMDIYKAIPHRPPFLFVDRVLEISDARIVAEKDLPPGLDFFKGHYPHFPIMPGALTLESIFQAGAILLSGAVRDAEKSGVPAVTRVKDAKFKRMVLPGDTLRLEVELTERLGPAFYMSGKAMVSNSTVAAVHFTCALVDPGKGIR